MFKNGTWRFSKLLAKKSRNQGFFLKKNKIAVELLYELSVRLYQIRGTIDITQNHFRHLNQILHAALEVKL